MIGVGKCPLAPVFSKLDHRKIETKIPVPVKSEHFPCLAAVLATACATVLFVTLSRPHSGRTDTDICAWLIYMVPPPHCSRSRPRACDERKSSSACDGHQTAHDGKPCARWHTRRQQRVRGGISASTSTWQPCQRRASSQTGAGFLTHVTIKIDQFGDR